MANENHITSSKLAAFHNVAKTINISATLPNQVFFGRFAKFFFFESDRLFSSSFVAIVSSILNIEGSTSCCLVNFSRTQVLEYQVAEALFLERRTSEAEYDFWLRRGGPAEAWLFSMDRYGCASDKGEWCIYCEKENDIAVLGLLNNDDDRIFASQLNELHAYPIGILMEKGAFAPFPFNSLRDEWYKLLIENYDNFAYGK
jgi:hypothetical protein